MSTSQSIGMILLLSLGAMAVAPASALGQEASDAGREDFFAGAPEGFIPPPLNPAGIQLETRRLGEGVYALVSNHAAVDNSGFIVGERGVLVIDAHINGAMAQQIIDAVRRVTDKPILYLVNTNYHGDHTFGNYRFPKSTTIIAHSATAERMKSFTLERELMLQTVRGDRAVFEGVELRLPDLVFERFMRVDLGDRHVELYHFGPGNTPGDVVVYEPHTGVAWTGNLVVGAGVIPPMFEYGASTHLATLARFRATLDVETIVPGHGGLSDGSQLGFYLAYTSELLDRVRSAVRAGKSLEQTLTEVELREDYIPLVDAGLRQFIVGLHRLNVVRTYEEETAPIAMAALPTGGASPPQSHR